MMWMQAERVTAATRPPNSEASRGVLQSLRESIVSLVVFVVVTAGAAFVGSIFTARGTDTWYDSLEKPFFNPPSWVFSVVWTPLYLAMAVAAWLVWRHGSHRRDVQIATLLYGVQLTLNALWSALFFGMESPLAGLVEIVVLFAAITAWYVAATRVESRARWLILPYMAWVAFAILLNGSIWWLNR
jgi:translocator protein